MHAHLDRQVLAALSGAVQGDLDHVAALGGAAGAVARVHQHPLLLARHKVRGQALHRALPCARRPALNGHLPSRTHLLIA